MLLINQCDGLCGTCWYAIKYRNFYKLIEELRKGEDDIEGNEICLQLMRVIDDL